MRTLVYALAMSAAISLISAPSAFAQHEGGREPAAAGRSPAGGPSGREVGGGRGGPDKSGKEKGAEKTTINHGNGEKSVVTSDKEGSNIERHGTTERTRETHNEAVDRIMRDAKARGEKADVQKK